MNSKLIVYNRERFNKGLDLTKSKLYNKPIYWFRMLSYEEVQRRLDLHYGGKLTIVEYRGTKRKGILHCKECGEFETKNSIGSYITLASNRKIDCELCKYREQLEIYSNYLNLEYMEVLHFKRKNLTTVATIRCNRCNHVCEHEGSYLTEIVACRNCENIKKRKEYEIILNKLGLSYIKHETDENKHTLLHFKCNSCKTSDYGFIRSTGYFLEECPTCKRNKLMESYKNVAKLQGKVLLKFNGATEVNVIHLFCGCKSVTRLRYDRKSTVCKHCSPKLVHPRSKPKPHNQHLVKEYLTILYNVKTLKDFLVEHNQLDNLPQSEAKTILEHIDGWIKNYEDIVNKYPNGDLGTVLENNPLYEKCKEVFYPLLKRYNLKIEGDGVIE